MCTRWNVGKCGDDRNNTNVVSVVTSMGKERKEWYQRLTLVSIVMCSNRFGGKCGNASNTSKDLNFVSLVMCIGWNGGSRSNVLLVQ